jgi:hypothetical protein
MEMHNSYHDPLIQTVTGLAISLVKESPGDHVIADFVGGQNISDVKIVNSTHFR